MSLLSCRKCSRHMFSLRIFFFFLKHTLQHFCFVAEEYFAQTPLLAVGFWLVLCCSQSSTSKPGQDAST